VFFAHLEGGGEPVVTADPAEVAEWRWVSWPAFRTVAVTAPWALSPWAAAQVPQLPG
jgi:isopentenyl-diphosphate delta-isomerase